MDTKIQKTVLTAMAATFYFLLKNGNTRTSQNYNEKRVTYKKFTLISGEWPKTLAALYSSIKNQFSYITLNAILHSEVPCEIPEELKRRDTWLGKFLFL